LSSHPSPYPRLGYSLAIKNIVKLIATERAVLSPFIYEIVEKSLHCLRLAESDDVSIGTADTMAEALSVCFILKFFFLLITKF
jgi:hypothetical protein